MFRAAWFAYVKLQSLDGDMTCPKCGPTPEVTIWDGVTLAFNRKHLLPSLEPPTLIHEGALVRDKVRYIHGQQCIPDRDVRKLMRKVLRGPSLILQGAATRKETSGDESESNTGEETEDDTTTGDQKTTVTRSEKAAKELLERAQAIPVLCESLSHVNKGLAQVFKTYFGLEAILNQRPAPEVYKQFFAQVCLA